MTDAQILTLAFAVIFPVSMLILSNSRIADSRDALRVSLNEAKETLRAEMREMKSDLNTVLLRIENKIDHIAETVADHRVRLDKLDGGKAS